MVENQKNEKYIKKEELKEKRIKQILTAATDIFARNGFHKASVNDIAKKAGVAKGTVYIYFESKEELFMNLLEYGFNRFIKKIEVAVKNIDDPVKKIETYFETSFKFIIEHKKFIKIIIFERPMFINITSKKFINVFSSRVRILEECINYGIKEGTFKKIDANSAAVAMIGGLNHLIFKWMLFNESYKLEREADLLKEIFIYGLLTKKD